MANKYLESLKEEKNKRKQRVIQSAGKLFFQQGINETTLDAIAEAADIGIASLYRYYKNKNEIVIAVAEIARQKFLKWEKRQIDNIIKRNESKGFNLVKELLALQCTLHRQASDYVRFMDDLDKYIAAENIDPSRFSFIQTESGTSSQLLNDAFLQGQKDGSIRNDIDKDLFIQTSLMALSTLSRKLLQDENTTDKKYNGIEYLEYLIEMCVDSICV